MRIRMQKKGREWGGAEHERKELWPSCGWAGWPGGEGEPAACHAQEHDATERCAIWEGCLEARAHLCSGGGPQRCCGGIRGHAALCCGDTCGVGLRQQGGDVPRLARGRASFVCAGAAAGPWRGGLRRAAAGAGCWQVLAHCAMLGAHLAKSGGAVECCCACCAPMNWRSAPSMAGECAP